MNTEVKPDIAALEGEIVADQALRMTSHRVAAGG